MLVLALATTICCVSSSVSSGEERLARLRFKSGEFVDGRLVPETGAETLVWQSPHFLAPLEFDWQHISSVDFQPTQVFDAESVAVQVPSDSKPRLPNGTSSAAAVPDAFHFHLSGGTRLSGDLASLDDKEVMVDSSILGQLRIERSTVRQIERRDLSSRILYEGPHSLDDWRSEVPQAWSFQRGAIQSVAHHSSIRGEIQIPEICFIELRLAWETRPDFIISLGVEKNASKDSIAAARLEVWDGKLTIVRESGKNADIAILSKLAAGQGNIELTIYMNQQDGLVSVFSSTGEMLVKLTVPFEKQAPLSDVLVSNGGSQLRLEKLNVYQWDGTLPDSSAQSGEFVVQTNGNVSSGRIVSFDKAAGTLHTLDVQSSPIPIASVGRIVLTAAESQSSELAESLTPGANSENGDFAVPNHDSIAVRLRDGSRLIGKWLGMTADNNVQFSVAELNQTVVIASNKIATILGSKSVSLASKAEGKTGRLISNGISLSGQLVSPPINEPNTVMSWKPSLSRSSLPINLEISGTIDYSMSAQNKTAPPLEVARAMQGIRNQPANERNNANRLQVPQAQVRIGASELYRTKFGLQPPTRLRAQIGLLMRTGDRIEGEVAKIDDRGVTFSSPATTTKFVPHDHVQSIVLSQTSKPLELSDQTLSRILTVPRISKNDPPTHLLIATNGDYLRGRLLSLDGETVTMEVRLEQVELPRKAIAQIIWLHDRNWAVPSETVAPATNNEIDRIADSIPPIVHAMLSNGDSLTFSPNRISDGRLIGTSSLLGECSVIINDLNLLLLGPDAASRALELQQESWKLSLARNPKVLDDELASQTGALRSSQRAPLVGKAAPDFTLEDLSGNPYRFSEHKGQVMVLDFWASWCGPCIVSMPEVARVVAEIGNDQVDLVAVNLQETHERIQSAINRIGLTATVVLDVDGEVAELYNAQAIPQTVIVDRDGIVRHVFVGSGSKFVEQFQAALSETVELAP